MKLRKYQRLREMMSLSRLVLTSIQVMWYCGHLELKTVLLLELIQIQIQLFIIMRDSETEWS